MKIRQPFFNADGAAEQSYVSEDWGQSLRDAAASYEEQPEEDSEEAPLESDETPNEEAETEVENEDDGPEEEEEVKAEPEDPEIDMGEGRQPIKMSELKAGYQRQSDYTKKTQELSTQRKEVESMQEKLKPTEEWLNFMEGNPWLFEQINTAIKEFGNSGTLPLEELLDDSEHGKYINHLMVENKRLSEELNNVKGEYEGVKLSSEMNKLQTDLKGEYGDLVTDEYMQKLQERGKTEKLSATTLREIADGHLAKQQLKATDVKGQTKKAAAKAIQTLAETKNTAPTKPTPVAAAPSSGGDDYSGMSWMEALKAAVKGK